MTFLDRLLGHFNEHRDPLYIQALSQILVSIRQTDPQTISKVVGKLTYKEDDIIATKAVCILLPLYFSQGVQPPKLTTQLQDQIHDVMRTARRYYHPTFSQMLVKAVNRLFPSFLPRSHSSLSLPSSSASLPPRPDSSSVPLSSVSSLPPPSNVVSPHKSLFLSPSPHLKNSPNYISRPLSLNPYQPTTIPVPSRRQSVKQQNKGLIKFLSLRDLSTKAKFKKKI